MSVNWLTPDRHAERWDYQQLLLKTPFRDARPSEFISDSNSSGSLREELEIRGIIDSARGGLAAVIDADAKRQLKSEDERAELQQRVREHEAMFDTARAPGDLRQQLAAAQGCDDGGVDDEDLERLEADIRTAFDDEAEHPTMPAPDLRMVSERVDGERLLIAYWHEAPGTVWRLKPSQLTSCVFSLATRLHITPPQL